MTAELIAVAQLVDANPDAIGACPFCKNTEGEVEQLDAGVYVVQCSDCMCQGPTLDTADLAIKAWNGKGEAEEAFSPYTMDGAK